MIQRVLKQFILGVGRASSGLGAFGTTKKPAAAAADEESGETQPLMPSKENTGKIISLQSQVQMRGINKNCGFREFAEEIFWSMEDV